MLLGDRIIQRLDQGLSASAAALNRITARALARIGPDDLLHTSQLFNQQDTAALQKVFAGVYGTGELLGRVIPRLKMRRRYAEYVPPLPEELKLLSPARALEYFQSLVPSLGLNPRQWLEQLERDAFTMAAVTNDSVLMRIRNVIIQGMQGGELPGSQTINQILLAAGMAPENPQYSEMVYRTNVMDAHAAGHDREMADPEMQEYFPAWLYSATIDENSRPEHAKRNDRMYDQRVPFQLVRGTTAGDVCNCRCTPIDLDKWDVEDRLAAGERLYTGVVR